MKTIERRHQLLAILNPDTPTTIDTLFRCGAIERREGRKGGYVLRIRR